MCPRLPVYNVTWWPAAEAVSHTVRDLHSLSWYFHIILNVWDLFLCSLFLFWNLKGITKSIKLLPGVGRSMISVVCTLEIHHLKSMSVSFRSYQCRYTTIIIPRLLVFSFLLLYWTPWPKSTWGRKGLFGLNFPVTLNHWGKLGQNLELKLKQKLLKMSYYCFLSLWLAWLVFV